jgi:hypothetical protein
MYVAWGAAPENSDADGFIANHFGCLTGDRSSLPNYFIGK